MTAIDEPVARAWRTALACALAVALIAIDATAAIFIVNEPWVRVAPNAQSAEAYMRLTSTDGATLVGITSEATAKIEMRPPGTGRTAITEIKLPAGEIVMLAPGANRFVLTGLNRTLKLGDRVGLVLTIEAADGSRTEIPVNAEVRRRSPTDDHRLPHKH